MINRNAVWRAINDGGPPALLALTAFSTDEEAAWAEAVAQRMMQEFALIMRTIDNYYLGLLDYIYDEDIEERREMAEWVKDNVPREYVGFVFSLLDSKDIQTKIWKMIEPVGGGK